MDTIPIEDFAKYVKSSFVSYYTDLAMTGILAVAPWSVPVSWLTRMFVEFIVTFIATKGGLVAFMINTKVFTKDQAKDYIRIINELHSLPDDVSDEDWEKKEDEANHYFHNIVNFAA